jgi:hypothetical protein
MNRSPAVRPASCASCSVANSGSSDSIQEQRYRRRAITASLYRHGRMGGDPLPLLRNAEKSPDIVRQPLPKCAFPSVGRHFVQAGRLRYACAPLISEGAMKVVSQSVTYYRHHLLPQPRGRSRPSDSGLRYVRVTDVPHIAPSIEAKRSALALANPRSVGW